MVYWGGSGMSGGSVIRGLGGGSVFGLCGRLSGAVAGVMERMRCCRWPCLWGSGSGWRSIFCHRTVWCGLDPQWWGLEVVQWRGSVESIGIGRLGVVAYASVG